MRVNLTIQWVVAYLLLPFHTAQYQKDSFLDAIMSLIFKLVHFMPYKPKKSFKNGYSTKNDQK